VLRCSVLIIVQRNATQSSLYIILQAQSTCFGCQLHPSSGVHKTVTTASGTGHAMLCSYLLPTWPSLLGHTKQSIYYSASSMYMFRVSTTPIIRSTQNCNNSLRYWSYFCAATFLQRDQVSLAVVTVLCTPDDGCG
jgi:hypothetical protein